MFYSDNKSGSICRKPWVYGARTEIALEPQCLPLPPKPEELCLVCGEKMIELSEGSIYTRDSKWIKSAEERRKVTVEPCGCVVFFIHIA